MRTDPGGGESPVEVFAFGSGAAVSAPAGAVVVSVGTFEVALVMLGVGEPDGAAATAVLAASLVA